MRRYEELAEPGYLLHICSSRGHRHPYVDPEDVTPLKELFP